MTIEIVSFPINSMVIFHSYVSLPEGISRHDHLVTKEKFHHLSSPKSNPLVIKHSY